MRLALGMPEALQAVSRIRHGLKQPGLIGSPASQPELLTRLVRLFDQLFWPGIRVGDFHDPGLALTLDFAGLAPGLARLPSEAGFVQDHENRVGADLRQAIVGVA